jgi:hypothetical protein
VALSTYHKELGISTCMLRMCLATQGRTTLEMGVILFAMNATDQVMSLSQIGSRSFRSFKTYLSDE